MSARRVWVPSTAEAGGRAAPTRQGGWLRADKRPAQNYTVWSSLWPNSGPHTPSTQRPQRSRVHPPRPLLRGRAEAHVASAPGSSGGATEGVPVPQITPRHRE